MAEEAKTTTKKKSWWAGLSETAKWSIYILSGAAFVALIYWLFFSGKAIIYEWADGQPYGQSVFAVRAKSGTFSQKKGDKVTIKASSDASEGIKKMDGSHDVLDVKEDGKLLILNGTYMAAAGDKATGTLS